MQRIFVTDFDGTFCERDFYTEVLARLMPPGTPNYYLKFLRGEMTHFDCLAAYFRQIQAPLDDVLALVDELPLDPETPAALTALREAGWEVVVASAGCRWYIERVLARAGVSLTIHANDGHWRGDGLGLQMERPTASPFYCPEVGIDKPAVVAAALQQAREVAFAGDGLTDVPAARLVPPTRRFAKSDCAQGLTRLGEPYRPFRVWPEVAHALLKS